jgi:hypothetical protein
MQAGHNVREVPFQIVKEKVVNRLTDQ